MMSSQGSTPVRRVATEKSIANTIVPEGSDSGYGSTGNTTDGSTTDHSQDFTDGVALPSRRFFERKITKLRLFDKEIPQLTQHRFHDLHELFERPLCEYLIKAKVNPNPISIKLKVLGESEATAKPWIVVLCSKMASKTIRHFFNQPQIKAEYQPSNTADSCLSSFKVFVCNRPPRPMAGTEIYSDYNESATMCGRMIKVGEAHQSRFATLGGIIKVVKPSGPIMLYGMTAGHILAQQPLGQDNFDQVDFCDKEAEEDEGFYSGEEEYELDDCFESDGEVQDWATTGGRTRTISESTQMGRLWPKIGCVSAASNEGTETGHDLDWTLIEFDKPADCRPNLLVSFDRKDEAARNSPLKENGKFTEDGSCRSVFLLSGTGGVKRGKLSTSLSFLMMGPAKVFTKTYTLVLPHKSVLNSGDCGSWVVEPSTCEVYGHVVASDAMGDTYVVPLNATLRDMEEKLGAAVFLPTEADIYTWLVQRAKAAAEQVIVPTRSKKKQVVFNDSEVAKFPRDLQKLAGHSLSQASTTSAPSAFKTSTPIVDYCNSCNAKFEGDSQDVRDNLLRHLRTCSRHDKDAASGTENSVSQNAKDTLDERSNRSSVKYPRDVEQKTTNNTSTQQMGSVPRSIRSMYSSFRNKSSIHSQQKYGENGKSISDSKDNNPAGSASSKKPAATASPAATAKDLKNITKNSDPKGKSATPPISKGLPARSLVLAGPISGDVPPAPAVPPVIPDRRLSGPIAAGQVSYEGYTFTKCDSKQTGQKETWAVARMDPMPVSQEDLKDQIEKNRKKHISALDEYNDKMMEGFKRKQVDNLIRERTKIDGDYGYEYLLASIKRNSRKTKKKISETVSMQVILKRQPIANFYHEPSTGPSIDFHAKLPSQIMDLTSGDELGKFRDYGGGSQDADRGGAVLSFAGRPEPGAIPVFPPHVQFFPPSVPHVDDRLSLFHAAPYQGDFPNSLAQGIGQPPHSRSVPLVYQEIHNSPDHLAKVNDSERKKKKAPKVVDTGPETRKKYDYLSNSPPLSSLSLELDSDNSWTKTDVTPDTVISGESREYRKEKKSHKESKISIHHKDNAEPMPYAHETKRPVYRDHRRDEHRYPSLSPARRSRNVSSDWSHPRHDPDLDLERHGRRATSSRYSYGTRYGDLGHYDIEPAVSFPANRAPRHRRSSVSPERPSHHRALSYEFDRSLAHHSQAFVPVHHLSGTFDHGGELAREAEGWERERLPCNIEEDEARPGLMREMWRHERDDFDAGVQRIREMEIRGRTSIERHGSRRAATYDDGYMPRHHRDSGYYY